MNTYEVIVIGGGASGMMAAGIAAHRGRRVLLIEKNRLLGEKVRISGGGRCNITYDERVLAIFLDKYGLSKEFLFSPFSQFGVNETFSFFEDLDLSLKTQARSRVFPISEKAGDVVLSLERYLKSGQVEVLTGCRVNKIGILNGRIEGIYTSKGAFFANSFILATGGVSHPETGSTGDGFSWLKEMGHTVKDPSPTIVPLAVGNAWVKKLAGTTLPDVKMTFFIDGVKSKTIVGSVLLTHFGLSGPLILNLAKEVGDWLQVGVVTVEIDLFPKFDRGSLERELLGLFEKNKNKELKTILRERVATRVVGVILGLLPSIAGEMKVHSITKEQRRQLISVLKKLPITITGLMGFDRAVVADGGVSLEEIDTKEMRSKVISNLFVTGDLLNINRPSGGFSLQLCWTTGFVAGKWA